MKKRIEGWETMDYKVLGGQWEQNKVPTKHEIVLNKLYELETIHFVNQISKPSSIKHPNEYATWKQQNSVLEETMRIFELNLENMEINLDELIEEFVVFSFDEVQAFDEEDSS